MYSEAMEQIALRIGKLSGLAGILTEHFRDV